MGDIDPVFADHFAAIFNSLPNGLLVTDADGRVLFLNPAFCRLVGLPADTPAGRPLAHYIRDENVIRLVLEVSSRCRPQTEEATPECEFTIGSDKILLARIQPISGVPRGCLGAVVNVMDITAMKVLDRLKNEFVAKVSHELRSPLSTIHEQLAMLLSDLAGQVSPADTHMLSRAKEKTKGLNALIGDLLDLSRIESGAVCKEPRPVPLEELLENIIAFLSGQAAAKKQQLIFIQPKAPPPPLHADPLALESIFGNLITNAINYSPEGGRIEVRLAVEGDMLEVSVTDNGFGIEERYMDKIFERFYRIKNEKTRFITGTGLGLPIVKGLVDSMRGRIRVRSRPGQGSTFTILLPLDSGNR